MSADTPADRPFRMDVVRRFIGPTQNHPDVYDSFAEDAIAEVCETEAELERLREAHRGSEGMVTVYAHDGSYLGCMGTQAWGEALELEADGVREEVERLRGTVADYEDDYRRVYKEACDSPNTEGTDDRVHCTCVAPLQGVIRELRGTVQQLETERDALRPATEETT